jgi:hypothetical protein
MRNYNPQDWVIVRSIVLGSVYERDGRQRLVTGVYRGYFGWQVQWCRPWAAPESSMALRAWVRWQNGATLVVERLEDLLAATTEKVL